ncbi:MAG: DUF401 family protein [candidate division Zixibacteria bacterium]|nr:DUF401 family protein [candidate division Zixibacteria bacterium]
MLVTWIGFLVSLAGILVISKKSLPLALVCGALLLGLFTLPISVIVERVIFTLTDASILFLAIAMGIVPMLGGTMTDSGQVESLVRNVRLDRRFLLPFSASLMGLMLMPGGALLSAPIVEKGGENIPDDLKAVINNWFRHSFILIYPLAPSLIVAAEITGLDVYRAIIYLLPGFVVASGLGYVFFLRQVHGRLVFREKFSLPGLMVPLAIILCAPFLDFVLKRAFSIGTQATLIGAATALVLSTLLSRRKLDLRDITIRTKPWNFALIIVGMFLYLHIFQSSRASDLIAALPLPPRMLAVTAGFLLGLLTGRVQLPASIILPVYLAAVGSVTPFVFALIYIAIYFGYVTSPVHPCLVVTCEYFHVPIKDMIMKMAPATAIIIIAVLVLSWLA